MRTKQTKTQKIRKLLSQGKTVAEIVKATGAAPSYVYVIRSKMKQAESLLRQHPVAGTWMELTPPLAPTHKPATSLFERIISRLAFWR